MSILNAKTQNFTPIGGLPTLTAQDIAYLKARVSEPASKYLDLIYSSSPGNIDKRWIYDISLAMRREVALFEGLEYWKPPRKDWILDMCAMALSEAVAHEIGETTCSWCSGRGEAKIDNLLVKCDGCGGSGIRAIKQEQRAEIMNSTEDFWDGWWNRYRRILGIIDIWHSEINLADAIRRKKDENN